MRLDKLIANMGYGSRKEVKALLKKKYVVVNEQVARDGRIHVDPYVDKVIVKGDIVHYREYIYIMMNKAQGYISATEDMQEHTVIDMLTNEMRHFNPFPVGRLDKDTEGLLLLTNDGELAHQLTSPKKEINKTYYAKVRGCVTEADRERLSEGVTLDDGYQTKPGKLTILKSDDISEIELTITEGKYHQVKRMFAALGKKVIYLKRIQMGQLTLDETIPLGSFRELTNEELKYCMSLKG